MKGRDGKELTPEEEEKVIKQGLAAGIISMGTGGTLHFVRKIADKHPHLVAESRTLKVAAPVIGGLGATLTGISAYKHYKHKKKKNDNTKK